MEILIAHAWEDRVDWLMQAWRQGPRPVEELPSSLSSTATAAAVPLPPVGRLDHPLKQGPVHGREGGSLHAWDDFPLLLCLPEAGDLTELIRVSVRGTTAVLLQEAASVPSQEEGVHASCHVCVGRAHVYGRVAAACAKLTARIEAHPLWRSTLMQGSAESTCQQRAALACACHKLVMEPLWHDRDHGHRLVHEDARMQEMLVALSFIRPEQLDLPARAGELSFSPVWQSACEWLVCMGRCPSPADKATCLLNCAKVVQAGLASLHAQGVSAGADSFFPALVYCLLQSGMRVPTLASDLHVVAVGLRLAHGVGGHLAGDVTIEAHLPGNEAGYVLTAVASALQWLACLNPSSLGVGVDDAEWHESRQEALAQWKAGWALAV